MNARRHIQVVLATLGALSGALVFSSTPALAEYIFEKPFEGSTIGEPVGLAVNQETGAVYIADKTNGVDVFNASGAPATPAHLAGDSSTEGYGVAVDNSSEPSKGDVYVTHPGINVVDQFDSSGNVITTGGEPFLKGLATPAGVAVDSKGNVYVAQYGTETVERYSSTGTLGPGNPIISGVKNPAALAINPKTGDVYVATSEGTFDYEASSAFTTRKLIDAAGHTGVAVDPLTEDIYVVVNGGKEIALYEPSGTLIEKFGSGQLTGGFGVGVNEKTGTVYITDLTTDKVYIYQLPPEVEPKVVTSPATGVHVEHAMLNGTVNPGSQAHYHFEYGTAPCKETNPTTFTCGAKTAETPLTGTKVTSVQAEATGLTEATTYHYWIVATNSKGTVHGEEGSFKTEVYGPKHYKFQKAFEGVALGNPLGVGVNQATGDVYVSDPGSARIYEFNSAGAWQSTTELPVGGNGADIYQLVVDNSGIPGQQGDVYVADLTGVVYKFDPNVTGGLVPDPTIPEIGIGSLTVPAAVAVDSSGNVYVANVGPGTVSKFSSAGVLVNPGLITGLGETARALAVDSSGNVYVGGTEGTTEYTSAGACVNSCTKINSDSNLGVAIDSSGDILTSDAKTVREYGPTSGHPPIENPELETGGLLKGPFGLAVANIAGTNTLYVADYTGKAVYIYKQEAEEEPSPQPPTVTTGAVSEVRQTTATLNGTINPNKAETEYRFEYGKDPGSYETSVPVPDAKLPTGTSGVPVSEAIGGLTLGTSYHYRLVATNKEGETDGLEEKFTTHKPPSATTGSASSITRTSATLNGTVNPNGIDTNYHFAYGTSTSYGHSAPAGSTDAGAGTANVAASAAVTDLMPFQAYHFRVYATSSENSTTEGGDAMFTTIKTPPTVDSGAAGEVTQTGAIIRGAVDPQSLQTGYILEIGASVAYGTRVTGEVGSGAGATPVELELGSLTPGTSYHYRLRAINEDGATAGADVTFTTPGNASPAATPTAPLVTQLPAVIAQSKPPTLVITGAKVTGTSLLVTVRTSAKGTVTFTGTGLHTTRKSLGLGVNKVRVPLSATVARARHRKIKLNVSLKVGRETASRSKTVEL
jgi:hypothetical protein